MLIPKFIPMPISVLEEGYGIVEACIIGYLDFYQKNEDFYCTNEELAELLHMSESTVKRALKNLNENGLIEISKTMREGGGQLRKIELTQNGLLLCAKINRTKGSNGAFHNIIQEEYKYIYSNYYGKGKGIDEKKCNKIIDGKLKQGVTLEEIKQCMVLYNCECRLKQDFQYVRKLENRLTEFQPYTEEQIDEQLYTIIKQYRDKKKSDEKFANSKPAKTVWNDLKETFGDEKVKSILKQVNSINLTFT